MPRKKSIRLVALALFACSALALSGCGDYKPCKVLAMRICEDCPRVSKAWQAACLCIQNGSAKEEGYKCLSPSQEDEARCNATLQYWDEQTCDLVN